MTETERLRAVAKHYRESSDWIENSLGPKVFGDNADASDLTALADLFDSIADRHRRFGISCCECERPWPCPDMRAALTVAAALGVEP